MVYCVARPPSAPSAYVQPGHLVVRRERVVRMADGQVDVGRRLDAERGRVEPVHGCQARRTAQIALHLEQGQLRVGLDRVRDVVRAAGEHVDALDRRQDVEIVLEVPAAEAVVLVRRGAHARQRLELAGLAVRVRRAHGRHVAEEAPLEEAAQRVAATRVGQAHEAQVVGPDVLPALVHRVGVLLLVVERDVRVVAVFREVADAGSDRRAVLVALAVGAGAGRAGDREARVLLAQDHVDHAGHRVGTVDRRCAVLQHLDALDGVERNLRQVDVRNVAVVGEAEVRHAAAVDEHERVVGAQAAQRYGGSGRGEAVGERRADRAVVVRGDLPHHVVDRLQAGGLDVLARDGLDGRGGLGVDPLDVGAGDTDPEVLRAGRTGGAEADLADSQRDCEPLPRDLHATALQTRC